MNIVVFEDDQVAKLHPITLGRPTYAITCGGFRLVDWLTKMSPCVEGLVRPHLQAIQVLDYPHLARPADVSTNSGCLAVNARLVPSHALFERLQSLVSQQNPVVVRQNDELAAVWLPAGCGIAALQKRDNFAAFE